MKNEIQPVKRERKLRKDDFIVSKTDTSGRIAYCNRIFIEISGYTECELLGQQHNIIRHPEMPRVVFHMLGSTLKEGREFFAYIKNLCKDGSYYWVFANLTPTLSSTGQVVGYYSVRRCPQESSLRVIEPIYAELLEVEKRAGSKQAIQASTQLLQVKLREYGREYERFVLEI